MLTIPKYLKFKICTYLKHVQISTMQQTAKYWYHLLDQDEFWSFKALNDYGDIAKTKPSYMTGRNWYYNLEQTGTLYRSGRLVEINCTEINPISCKTLPVL